MLTSPIFVLSHGRSGSTMIRYVLDAHTRLCCPPEIEIGKLCSTLWRTVMYTQPHATASTPQSREDAVGAVVRANIDGLMREYCDSEGKPRWCDKSVSNIDHLDLLHKVFDDARYICLYRNALDVVHSCLEACRLGFVGRLAEFVARQPTNLVDAIIDSWCERCETMIAFEQAHAASCILVRYEDFVASPATVGAQIFEAVGEVFEPDVLTRAFSMSHRDGPGDPKARFTSTVERRFVGKGSMIPVSQISPDRKNRMNRVLRRLGYAEVGEQATPSADEISDVSNGRLAIEEMLSTALVPRLQREPSAELSGRLKFEIIEASGRRNAWLCDPAKSTIQHVPCDQVAECTFALSPDALASILAGDLNVAEALMQLRLSVSGDEGLAMAFASRYLRQ